MATNTPNYNLIKPDPTEFYNIADNNNNADVIDAALKANADGIAFSQEEIEIMQQNYFFDNTPMFNRVGMGDFAGGMIGWNAVDANVISSLNKELTFLATAQGGRVYSMSSMQAGRKYLIFGQIKASSALVRLDVSGTAAVNHSGGGGYEFLTSIFTAPTGGTVQIGIRDQRTSGWNNVSAKFIGVIDLTEAFGQGTEPAVVDDLVAWLEARPNKWLKATNAATYDATLQTRLDFEEHLADYEAKIPWDDSPLIDSGGSSATGYWNKFPTGLMILWREVTLDLSTTNLQTFAMPQTFLPNPSASMSTDESITGGVDFSSKRSAVNSCPIANNVSEWRIRLSTTYTGTISARLTAIGRWK